MIRRKPFPAHARDDTRLLRIAFLRVSVAAGLSAESEYIAWEAALANQAQAEKCYFALAWSLKARQTA